MTITVSEMRLVVCALRRAIDWSDIHDNGKALGKTWKRRESSYLARSRKLLDKMNAELLARLEGE